jgi:hypothetical protein
MKGVFSFKNFWKIAIFIINKFKMKRVVKLTEADLVRLTKKIIKEGLRVDLNPADLIAKINTLPNKTAQVVVEGGDLVFIINGQRIGLDCTTPSQGSPANTDKPVLPGRKLGTTLEPNQPKVRQ